MVNLLFNISISVFMVVLTALMYYEILRFSWARLPQLKIAPRARIIYIILTIFTGHTFAIWLYGFVYWLMAQYDLGSLGGDIDNSFFAYIYYSAATYSSLGLGDIFPQGHMRFLTGVEVLNGLVLIGWSVSFTYLAMERFWNLHGKRNKPKSID